MKAYRVLLLQTFPTHQSAKMMIVVSESMPPKSLVEKDGMKVLIIEELAGYEVIINANNSSVRKTEAGSS